MVSDIKELMRGYELLNEAELFVTDLKFRSHQTDSQEFIGDIGKNKEDLVREI
jgi:hypothetical protein